MQFGKSKPKMNVGCLEDGTLVWYDQSTEGIALTMFYLHFIPPSPYNEAGQDRRKISIHILYLDANSKIRQVCSRPLQSRQLKAGHFSKRFFQEQYELSIPTKFQPCWAWIPFTVFPDQNLSSYKASHNFSSRNHLQYLYLQMSPYDTFATSRPE